MQEFNFNQHITQLLKADNRLVDEENDIQINVLRDLVNNLDSQLIELLITDDKVREKFFIKIKDVYVFKQNDFIFYLDSKVLDGSYTQYANRIGLASGGKFLTDSTDYVLDFPYKDCVLEGGQSTEEGNDIYFEFDADTNDYVEKTAKRKEIFYNNIIAKDEIDRLLEPKAFQKVVRYDANGETIPTSFTRDAELNRQRGLPEDTITDNLIIKGNNLLALHSLEKEFKGKVKLIYIDPPYNTEKDSFTYNDKFSHSAWLTFMYNRLKISYNLLNEDGLLFISCDDKEQAYLKVLVDSIYLRENFIANLPTIMNLKGNNDEFGFAGTHEYTLVYAKNKTSAKINDFDIDEEELEKWDIDDIGYYKKGAPLRATGDEDKREDRKDMFYPILIKNNSLYSISKEEHSKLYNKETDSFDDIYLNNLISKYKSEGYDVVLPMSDLDFGRWRWGFSEKNTIKLSTDVIINKTKNGYTLYKKQRPDLGDLPSKKPKSLMYKAEYSSGNGTAQVKKIFKDKVFKNPKPIDLLIDIFKIGSNDNDIILDFFVGSGTTGHAINELNYHLKTNRQFILIEQLDYVENITNQRLIYSINSKKFGSFVYAELAKNNETAKERIAACNSLEDLLQLFEELNTRYFLDYNVRIKDFKENIIKEEAFINLSLARQKELFKRMLDNNQLYVNLSEVEDARYKLSEDAIRLTKDFYQIKN